MKNSRMSTSFRSLRARSTALAVAVALSVLTVGARPASAEELSCRVVEAIATGAPDVVLELIDEHVGGTEVRLTPRKRLVIHGAERIVAASGCRVTIDFAVTLERRLRRDAHGTARVQATVGVRRVDPANVEICFSDPKVLDLELSRTSAIGELAYTGVANRFMPENACYVVPFAGL